MGDGDPHLVVTRREHVLWVTLNRPERRNAISPEVVCRLAEAWDRVDADPDIRVAVLTGRGPVFSAGADLRLLIPLLNGARPAENEWDERVLARPEMAARAFLRRGGLTKPLIAAVNGTAAGGGFELVLASTLRIAASTARFGLAEVQRGLVPGGGGLARLPRQIPRILALELLLTGELVDAERAQRMAIVNQVVPDAELATAAGRLAGLIAANGPVAVRLILDATTRAEGLGLDAALDVEDEAFAVALASDDAQEGARAFLERRPPAFPGR